MLEESVLHRLNKEQAAFREVLVRFVDQEIRPVAREMDHSGSYPATIVQRMAEMGLFGLAVPEAYGGMGADSLSLALAFEELSRGWMGVAGILGSHTVSCRLIGLSGTEEQRQSFLPGLASGRRRSGIALTEPGAGSDLQAITTVARRAGQNYIVK